MEGAPKTDNEVKMNPELELKGLKEIQGYGYEILQNIDITEKNQDFVSKILNTQYELSKRFTGLHVDPDTGEQKKSGKSELELLKEDTLKETKEQLTRPSKYVKASVINGLIAAGLFTDVVFGGPVSSTLGHMEIKHENIADTLLGVDLVVILGTAVFAAIKAGKAISQQIKTKVASNQKIQRIIAMMATGDMNKEQAQKTVGMETRQHTVMVNPDGNPYHGEKTSEAFSEPNHHITKNQAENLGGYVAPDKFFDANNNQAQAYFDYDKATLDSVRNKLDAIGIKRVSREKYKG